MKTAIKTILSLSSIALCAAVTGCGIGGVSAPTTLNVAANVVTGKVMGGQQPVYGSAIQMYEVGITGYGSARSPCWHPIASIRIRLASSVFQRLHAIRRVRWCT